MSKNKKSFFERLTGSVSLNSEEHKIQTGNRNLSEALTEENEEAQLTVDVFQTENDIIIQAIVAGVKENDLDISITQDMITIRGERENKTEITKENYYYQELYWGTFSRSILLPQEVNPDEAEANLKNGVLTIKLPRLDKERVKKVKIKTE
mgnify:CR=1 FL=1|jgi:HSP20 family protein